MHLFLTGVLPFLAHNHPSAAAFLTCRHRNFHSSMIPEFLSDEERVELFCEARQQNQLRAVKTEQSSKLYTLFIQTPLMQFSSSLVLRQKDCVESILKPLLAMKYFSRTLQDCAVKCPLSNGLFECLSQVQSLTKLDLVWLESQHLEIIVSSFPSLDTLTIQYADCLRAQAISSPPSAITRSLRSLTIRDVEPLFASQFVSKFPNLETLILTARAKDHFRSVKEELDLCPLSSSLPLLTDMTLEYFILTDIGSLKELSRLSLLSINACELPDSSLSFLAQENSLPRLTTLRIIGDYFRLSNVSFASLSHASNLHVLKIKETMFNNSCLKYLNNMIHLRSLDLSESEITGVRRPMNALMQNLFQLEELNLHFCRIGGQGAIAGALYSTHSRLRVLNLSSCGLVDGDLKGIGALKNTLEVLDLGSNLGLTSGGLMHCSNLVKLRKLDLRTCNSINDLSPLKDCVNLEELDVAICIRLTDDSFKVFSEEPTSFSNLRMFRVSSGEKLTGKVLEHLANNHHLVYQLRDLDVGGMSKILTSSATARNSLCQLKGLRRLRGVASRSCLASPVSESDQNKLKGELMQSLKNLERVD